MSHTEFTPLTLDNERATKIGLALLRLLNKRLRSGAFTTSRGPKTPVGLTACLVDILKINSTGDMTATDEHASGMDITTLLRLRRDQSSGRFNTSVGDKTEKGLALTVARLFSEPDFASKILSPN